MKIELARKSPYDPSWTVSYYEVDKRVYRRLANELVRVQTTDDSIYYRSRYSINLSNGNQVYHFYLTGSGYRRVTAVIVRLLRDTIRKSGRS